MSVHSDSTKFIVKIASDIPIKKLQGRIYRLHVRGPKGFRFVDQRQQIVLPVYVSPEVKAKFDYEKMPWREYAAEIYEDRATWKNLESLYYLIKCFPPSGSDRFKLRVVLRYLVSNWVLPEVGYLSRGKHWRIILSRSDKGGCRCSGNVLS